MERKDLLQINKKIFTQQAYALSSAKPDVKCLVVANPANTNAYILHHFAPNLNPRNISCLSRLDHNRALGQIATKTGVEAEQI
jgi:malate dehydrogenase